MKSRPKIEVENFNHPGQFRLVDAAMYSAMSAQCSTLFQNARLV